MMMNPAPPIAIAANVITVNISNMSVKIVNNIMFIHSPFIQ